VSSWSPRTRRIALTVVALVVAQAAAVFVFRMVSDRRTAEAPAAFEVQALHGEASPVLELVTVTGARLSLEQFRGAPVLVHFWASWCTPCRKELPALLEQARDRETGMRVVAISVDTNWEPVRLFFGGAIPEQVTRLARDGDQRRFGVTTLPETFVVSASGKLVARMQGARDWTSEQARRQLQAWH
jgi:thiol-disulfide isomerase/thioredoxin